MADNPRFSRKSGNTQGARNIANGRANILENINNMPNLIGDEILNESFKSSLASRSLKLSDGTTIKTRRQGGINRVRVNQPPPPPIPQDLRKPEPIYDIFLCTDVFDGNYDFIGYWMIPLMAFNMGNGFFVPNPIYKGRLHYSNRVDDGEPIATMDGKKYVEQLAYFNEYQDTISSTGGQVGATQYTGDNDHYQHPGPVWSGTAWFHEGYDDCHGDWTQSIQIQGHGWYFQDSDGLWVSENSGGWGQHMEQYGTCAGHWPPMNPLAKTIGSCTYDACTVVAQDKMLTTGTATHYGVVDDWTGEHRYYENFVKSHPFHGSVVLHFGAYTMDRSVHWTGPSGGTPPLFFAWESPKSVTLTDPSTWPQSYQDSEHTEIYDGTSPIRCTSQGWKSATEHGYVWGNRIHDRVRVGVDDFAHRSEAFWYKSGQNVVAKEPTVNYVPLKSDVMNDTWVQYAKCDGITRQMWSGSWVDGPPHENPWYYWAVYGDNGYYKVNEGLENEYRVWFLGGAYYRYRSTPYTEEMLEWKIAMDMAGQWFEISLNGPFHSEHGGYIVRGVEGEDAPEDVYFIGLQFRLVKSEPE